MDNVTLIARDFLSSLTNGHAVNDLEWAMADIFTEIVQELQIDQLNDIYNYVAPWQGCRTVIVVERFTKFNGLAVLSRDNGGLSDKLMSVIYADWESIASERGVSFLQFVLDMLYPTQSVVIPLLHSKAFANSYPRHVSEIQGQGRFLTSRVRIKIDAAFNIAELAPTLSRLVPWQVVPEIAVDIDTTEDMGISVAVASTLQLVGNFSPY